MTGPATGSTTGDRAWLNALGNLINNIFRRQIFSFVLTMAAVAVLLFWLPFEPVGKIILFAALCFLWSMAFPLIRSALPKNAADFWYYVFAGVGAVLFFLNASEQREKVALAQMFNILNVELTELDAKRNRIKSGVVDPTELFARIKRLAGETSRALEARKDICSEIAAEAMRKQLELITKGPARDKNIPTIDLDQGFERSCENVWSQSEFNALANLTSAKDFETFLKKTSIKDLEEAIGLKLEGVTLAEFAEYLVDPMQWDRRAVDLNARLQATLTTYSEIGRKLNPGSRLEFAEIQQLVWPYLILMALAIKLARTEYCKQAGRDA